MKKAPLYGNKMITAKLYELVSRLYAEASRIIFSSRISHVVEFSKLKFFVFDHFPHQWIHRNKVPKVNYTFRDLE